MNAPERVKIMYCQCTGHVTPVEAVAFIGRRWRCISCQAAHLSQISTRKSRKPESKQLVSAIRWEHTEYRPPAFVPLNLKKSVLGWDQSEARARAYYSLPSLYD